MKMKKLLALVLSAVMAVTMLTACGGGGSSSRNVLDLNKVNSIIEEQKIDAKAENSNVLNTAVRSMVENMEKTNNFSAEAAYAYLKEIRNYPGTETSYADAIVIVLPKSNLGENQAESLVAEMIISGENEAVNTDLDVRYYVSATTATAQNGTVYIVIGFEMAVSL